MGCDGLDSITIRDDNPAIKGFARRVARLDELERVGSRWCALPVRQSQLAQVANETVRARPARSQHRPGALDGMRHVLSSHVWHIVVGSHFRYYVKLASRNSGNARRAHAHAPTRTRETPKPTIVSVGERWGRRQEAAGGGGLQRSWGRRGWGCWMRPGGFGLRIEVGGYGTICGDIKRAKKEHPPSSIRLQMYTFQSQKAGKSLKSTLSEDQSVHGFIAKMAQMYTSAVFFYYNPSSRARKKAVCVRYMQ